MAVSSLPIRPPSLTLSTEATVGEAMSLMIQREVNHIPVCGADGRFVGLLGRSAIQRALLPAGPDAGQPDAGAETLPILIDRLRANEGRPVRELLNGQGAAIRYDTPMLEAARRLSESTTPLAVIDEEGHLLGMLSRRILLTLLLDKSRSA